MLLSHDALDDVDAEAGAFTLRLGREKGLRRLRFRGQVTDLLNRT